MKPIFALLLLFNSLVSLAQDSTAKRFRKDFDFLWSTIREDYCYWDKKTTDWTKVRAHYGPIFDTITSRHNFVLLLEKVFNEIYDHHASLSTNTKVSQRLVPSGTDIWAEYINGKPIITEVRLGFGAHKVGIKAGMEVVSANDIPVEKAVQQYLPISLSKPDKEAKDYALRVLLAGLSTDDRKITVKEGSQTKTFFPDRPLSLLIEHKYNNDIESKVLTGNIGYIRINNNLWDNNLIPLFDSVLHSLRKTKALILDLRETPSGGNTTVARAIIGSFIGKEGFYQKHELTAEERTFDIKRSWVELVSPRKNIYTRPLVVLVNHWTGSVGEGITIGFDALKRVTVIGTSMARLNGAMYSYQMPETKIGFSFPVEKLFHVNGKPRETFLPAIMVDVTKQKQGEDAILSKAFDYLNKK
jgi:C-terminal processing protease CtpA/Prc